MIAKASKLVARQAGKIKSAASVKDMIVVIQCAAGKDQSVGHMLAKNGRKVMFVADPQNAPPEGSTIYKHPDDPALSELSWRDLLVKYNRKYKDTVSGNPLGLLPACELYKPRPPHRDIYRELVKVFGIQNIFILSAGWGLIPAGFLTPNYDITFSAKADTYKRRRRQDLYKDLAILPKDIEKPVVFLGGKNYIPLFLSLTRGTKSERIVFYNSETVPDAPGCRPCHFSTKTRTNWHYECARELARGNIDIGGPKDVRTVSKREISEALIEFAKGLDHSEDFEMPEKVSTRKEANHFFVGVMLDRMVKASVAWNSGKLIVREYGGGEIDFWKIIGAINRDELHEFMKSGDGGKALHFYHGEMTDNLKHAARLMLEKYDGDPRKIWQVKKNDIKEVKRRLREFHGIGEQLASMAVMILVRDYGNLGGKKSFPFLVPKEDVHTKKVFQRTGLTRSSQTVVEVARELNPDFPAILDEPAWIIGKEYCFKNNPNCKECPITGVCGKNI